MSSKTKSRKPLIRLLRSPRGYWFFDANRNSVCQVDETVYRELETIMNGTAEENESAAVAQLKADGWLSGHRPHTIHSDMTDQVETRLTHYVNQLNLQVTQACNLTCSYCPYATNTDPALSRHHTDKRMSWETAKKAIDFLAEHSDGKDQVYVCFYGGEPLVACDLVRKCVEYAEDVLDGKEILYLITTNATLMTDEVLDFLVSHHFFITFSLDGPKQIHDRHRLRADGTPTYDLVMHWLERAVALHGNKPDAHVGINMVLDPSDDLDEILSWLDQPLLKNVIVEASVVEDDNLEKKYIPTPDFRKKLTYQTALSWLKQLGLVDGLKTSVFTDGIVRRGMDKSVQMLNAGGALPDTLAPSGPCMSGFRKLFVNAEGAFFPCEKVNELSPCMRIGDVDHGFDYEQVKRHINIGELTPDACRNCWAIVNCFTCQRQADGGETLSGEVKNRYCEEVRNSVQESLERGIMVRESRTVYHSVKGVDELT